MRRGNSNVVRLSLLAMMMGVGLSGPAFGIDTPLIATSTLAITPITFPASAGPMIFTSTEPMAFVSTTSAAPPIVSTPLLPTQSLLFGTTVEDPYRWLEEEHSDKVKSWVAAQDRMARDYLSFLPIRESVRRRLKELLSDEQVSVPQEAGGRIFFTHRSAKQDKRTIYWRPQGRDEDHVLLKPRAHSAEDFGEWSVSPDGKKLAYQWKENNSDEAVLHVRNVDSWHENSKDVIAGADFVPLSWTEDSKGFYYVGLPAGSRLPPTGRAGQAAVRFHALGKASKWDPIVYPESHNSSLSLSPSLSSDGMWLFVTAIHGRTSTDIFFREVRDNSPAFKPLFLSTAATAQVTEWGGVLYMRTNEGAPNYRIVKTFIRQPDRSSWVDIVPERADTVIRTMNFVGGYLILTIMRNTLIGIEVRTAEGSLVRTALEPVPGEIHEIKGQESSDTVYFEFNAVVVPPQIYRLTVPDGAIKTWSAPAHSIDDSPYQGTQVNYRSKDGTLVSMDIIERKGLPLDGSVPFLMEGYGAFGVPAPLRFDPKILLWLEAGGGYALAHIRGGGEYGETWHEAGMLAQKQNTFDDFIAAAEYLIENKYTSRERLVIQGVSHGGLLMGAAMTQRPDLFRAVVCKSPLFDMIRYPLFGEGPAWVPEYGSPEVEDQFRTLLAYSPYHHVQSGTAYPATLLISPENDDRMDPMHARKMTSSLQAATASPILLETERKAGHDGLDSKQSEIDEDADWLSFLMNAVRMEPSP